MAEAEATAGRALAKKCTPRSESGREALAETWRGVERMWAEEAAARGRWRGRRQRVCGGDEGGG